MFSKLNGLVIPNVDRKWQILCNVLNIQYNCNEQYELFMIGTIGNNKKKKIVNSFNTLFANIGKMISDNMTQLLKVDSCI